MEFLKYGDKKLQETHVYGKKNPDIPFCSGKVELLLRPFGTLAKRWRQGGRELTEVWFRRGTRLAPHWWDLKTTKSGSEERKNCHIVELWVAPGSGGDRGEGPTERMRPPRSCNLGECRARKHMSFEMQRVTKSALTRWVGRTHAGVNILFCQVDRGSNCSLNPHLYICRVVRSPQTSPGTFLCVDDG